MKRSAKRRRMRAGVTMIEAVASMVIVSGAMVAALNAVSAARATQITLGERGRARLLAESLMAEALAKDYMEVGSTSIGPDSGESGGNTRSQYDDVDDYDGWSNDVLAPDGSEVAGFEGYELSFAVEWVSPSNPGLVVGTDQGVKRVTVTIQRNSRVVAELRGWTAEP
ncbi:MAG: hypothetical protein ACIAXF_07475 [Phycisphaerales bacterium JB063]